MRLADLVATSWRVAEAGGRLAQIDHALYVDGDPLVDEPLTCRIGVLGEQATSEHLGPRIVTAQPDEAAAFVGV